MCRVKAIVAPSVDQNPKGYNSWTFIMLAKTFSAVLPRTTSLCSVCPGHVSHSLSVFEVSLLHTQAQCRTFDCLFLQWVKIVCHQRKHVEIETRNIFQSSSQSDLLLLLVSFATLDASGLFEGCAWEEYDHIVYTLPVQQEGQHLLYCCLFFKTCFLNSILSNYYIMIQQDCGNTDSAAVMAAVYLLICLCACVCVL